MTVHEQHAERVLDSEKARIQNKRKTNRKTLNIVGNVLLSCILGFSVYMALALIDIHAEFYLVMVAVCGGAITSLFVQFLAGHENSYSRIINVLSYIFVLGAVYIVYLV